MSKSIRKVPLNLKLLQKAQDNNNNNNNNNNIIHNNSCINLNIKQSDDNESNQQKQQQNQQEEDIYSIEYIDEDSPFQLKCIDFSEQNMNKTTRVQTAMSKSFFPQSAKTISSTNNIHSDTNINTEDNNNNNFNNNNNNQKQRFVRRYFQQNNHNNNNNNNDQSQRMNNNNNNHTSTQKVLSYIETNKEKIQYIQQFLKNNFMNKQQQNNINTPLSQSSTINNTNTSNNNNNQMNGKPIIIDKNPFSNNLIANVVHFSSIKSNKIQKIIDSQKINPAFKLDEQFIQTMNNFKKKTNNINSNTNNNNLDGQNDGVIYTLKRKSSKEQCSGHHLYDSSKHVHRKFKIVSKTHNDLDNMQNNKIYKQYEEEQQQMINDYNNNGIFQVQKPLQQQLKQQQQQQQHQQQQIERIEQDNLIELYLKSAQNTMDDDCYLPINQQLSQSSQTTKNIDIIQQSFNHSQINSQKMTTSLQFKTNRYNNNNQIQQQQQQQQQKQQKQFNLQQQIILQQQQQQQESAEITQSSTPPQKDTPLSPNSFKQIRIDSPFLQKQFIVEGDRIDQNKKINNIHEINDKEQIQNKHSIKFTDIKSIKYSRNNNPQEYSSMFKNSNNININNNRIFISCNSLKDVDEQQQQQQQYISNQNQNKQIKNKDQQQKQKQPSIQINNNNNNNKKEIFSCSLQNIEKINQLDQENYIDDDDNEDNFELYKQISCNLIHDFNPNEIINSNINLDDAYADIAQKKFIMRKIKLQQSQQQQYSSQQHISSPLQKQSQQQQQIQGDYYSTQSSQLSKKQSFINNNNNNYNNNSNGFQRSSSSHAMKRTSDKNIFSIPNRKLPVK